MVSNEKQAAMKKLAEEFRASTERSEVVVSSILFGLCGAMAAGEEELLMNHVARFSQTQLQRLSATRN